MQGDYSSCGHRNHYGSKSAAKRAAKSMGLSGCHTMRCQGKSVYMPGESHDDYMNRNSGTVLDKDGDGNFRIPGL